MKKLLPVLTATLIVTGCGNGIALPSRDTSLQEELNNPLYAEYYYDDLTEQMVRLALDEDPLLQDPNVRSIVDHTRTRSLEHANVAMKQREKGIEGIFLSDRELVLGEALLLEDVLYFSPTFDCAPGPKLNVYLTEKVDPREGSFPDETAVFVGPVKTQYGAQSFKIPTRTHTGTGTLRTVVLWDDELELLYGFAQLTNVASRS